MQAMPKITNKGYGLFDFQIQVEEDDIRVLMALAKQDLIPKAWLWDCDTTWVNFEMHDGTCVAFFNDPKEGCGMWIEDFYRPVGEDVYDGTLEPTEPSLDNLLHVASIARQMLALVKGGSNDKTTQGGLWSMGRQSVWDETNARQMRGRNSAPTQLADEAVRT